MHALPRRSLRQLVASARSHAAVTTVRERLDGRGRETRAVAIWGTAAAAVLSTVLLPQAASARTVQPTTPGSSVFTSAARTAGPAALVQIGPPSSYRLPISASTQQAVAFASNLAGPLAAAPAVAAAAAPAAPAAQPQPQPQAQAQAPAWSAPAPGAAISKPFGVPDRQYAAGYHTGVDFAVDSGTPLLAVTGATVVSAGPAGAYGNDVVLQLPDGRFALYAHMSRVDVHAGQTVTAGQQVGLSGATGHVHGPHLHFEIRTANAYGQVTDPVGYLTQHGAANL